MDTIVESITREIDRLEGKDADSHE
jgi:hypothetical protein